MYIHIYIYIYIYVCRPPKHSWASCSTPLIGVCEKTLLFSSYRVTTKTMMLQKSQPHNSQETAPTVFEIPLSRLGGITCLTLLVEYGLVRFMQSLSKESMNIMIRYIIRQF